MTIRIREKKNYDPWLVVLCVVLWISTIGFAFLAVRNAQPMSCDSYETVDFDTIKCIKVISR